MKVEQPRTHRYEPRYCTFRHDNVWAIVAQQADGSWKIVNCLDKDEGCFGVACTFTTDHGVWPYRSAPKQVPS